MSIETSSIAIGTAISVTGGTATSLISKGNSLDKHNLALDDGSAYADQKGLSFSVKEPKVSAAAPAGYTQGRNIVVLSFPKTLANGETTINTMKIELSTDRETTDAERDSYREVGAQVVFDTDFNQYWNSLSVS